MATLKTHVMFFWLQLNILLLYEIIYQLDAIEYLFVYFQLDTNKYSIASSW